MRIGAREVGVERGPYVIAEIGVNHDGSGARALELVRAAARAGVDAVKFQFFRADLLMGGAARLAAYQREAGERDPREMLRRLELPGAALVSAGGLARELGVHAIVTAFSVELVGEVEETGAAFGGWDAYKSASPDIVHRPLLEALASTGRPLVVSTGASTMEEVSRAVGWLSGARGRLALLQCVSCYPAPAGQEGLEGIAALAGAFGVPVGYSDHTPGVETGARAVELGACVLEKHLTYDRGASGPDHAASLEPEEMAAYCRLARARWAERGMVGVVGAVGGSLRAEKRVLDCERDVRAASRQSLTATRALRAGERLERADLTFKRPGTGMEAWRLGEAIGRRLVRDVERDMPLAEVDVV